MSCDLSCDVASASPAGLGGSFGGDCGTSGLTGNAVINVTVTPNAGSSFVSWYCKDAPTFTQLPTSDSNANTTITTPSTCSSNSLGLICEATFALAPPPVSASVESDVALALTLIGVMLISFFKLRKTRKT